MKQFQVPGTRSCLCHIVWAQLGSVQSRVPFGNSRPLGLSPRALCCSQGLPVMPGWILHAQNWPSLAARGACACRTWPGTTGSPHEWWDNPITGINGFSAKFQCLKSQGMKMLELFNKSEKQTVLMCLGGKGGGGIFPCLRTGLVLEVFPWKLKQMISMGISAQIDYIQQTDKQLKTRFYNGKFWTILTRGITTCRTFNDLKILST